MCKYTHAIWNIINTQHGSSTTIKYPAAISPCTQTQTEQIPDVHSLHACYHAHKMPLQSESVILCQSVELQANSVADMTTFIVWSRSCSTEWTHLEMFSSTKPSRSDTSDCWQVSVFVRCLVTEFAHGSNSRAAETNKCGTDGASLRYFTCSSAQSCQCLND